MENKAEEQWKDSWEDTGVPGISAEDRARLKKAQEQITRGRDRAQTEEGMSAQREVLRNNGIVYPGARGENASDAPERSGARADAAADAGQELTAQGNVLDAWRDAAVRQQSGIIDHTVQRGAEELEQAQWEAQEQFQDQLDQTDREEAKALDNQVLYAEARGDRGGIGQAQYAQIQSTAMENRRAIHTARAALAAQTARQVADLRAQGEFKKADAVLQLTQEHLAQLTELQQWGAEYALSQEQVRQKIEQWHREFAAAQGEEQYQKDLHRAQLLAEAGDFSGYKALGYSDAQIAALSRGREATAEKTAPEKDAAMHNSLTSLSIDRAVGIYLWNGKRFETLDELAAAVSREGLTDEEITQLNRNAAKYGLHFTAER